MLTDYDLSSWVKDLKGDYKKTSQQRTGTPPYMAHELLKGTSPLHLYRHDVESLFYIILLLGARHTIGTPKGEEEPRVVMRYLRALPYQKWFDQQDFEMLGSLKGTFFSDKQPIELSSAFEDFRPWLKSLQSCFSRGFVSRLFNEFQETPAEFDEATLGGHITFDKFVAPVSSLTGTLEGLAIRRPECPPAPTVSASAGTTQDEVGSDRYHHPAPTILSSIDSPISSTSKYLY